MVRVCLYLALALGLTTSASGAACTLAAGDISVANNFVNPAGGTDYVCNDATCSAASTTQGDCTIAILMIKQGESCQIGCKANAFMISDSRKSRTHANVICDTAGTLTKPECTECTTVENMATNANEPTCSGAKDSQVSACATGFWLHQSSFSTNTGEADLCEGFTSQDNCDADAATQQGSTKNFACTTAAAGYKVVAGDVQKCVSDLTFGMSTYNGNDNAPKATGITCKNDGTEIRIPSCPAGTFKTEGTGTASDTCTACTETSNSRCHCTGATVAKCLATGSCKSGFTGYIGDGAGKAPTSKSCAACKTCQALSTSTKVAQYTKTECSSTNDIACADCTAVAANANKVGQKCYNGAFSDQKCNANYVETPATRATASATSNQYGCGKTTCECPSTHWMNTAATPVCATCATAAVAGKYTKTKCSATVNRVVAACGAGQAACSATQYKVLGSAAADQCDANNDYLCKTAHVCAPTTTIGTGTGWVVTALGTAAGAAATDNKVCLIVKKDSTHTAYHGISRVYPVPAADESKDYVSATAEFAAFTAIGCTGDVTGGTLKAVITATDSAQTTLSDTAGASKTDTQKATVAMTETGSIEMGNAAGADETVYLCMRNAKNKAPNAGTAVTEWMKIATITLKKVEKDACTVQEWDYSFGGKCKVTNAAKADGSTVGQGGTIPELMQVTRQTGYNKKCTVTCAGAHGPFAVSNLAEVVACTEQKGCTTSSADCADDGNSDANALAYHSYKPCTIAAKGYYLVEDTKDVSTTGSYDVVKSCIGAGQETASCTDACWITAKCKAGFTKTVGAGVSDTCVSDSAASLSLTAVLLSVVAKVFLF